MNLLYFVITRQLADLRARAGALSVRKAFGVKVITFSLGFGPKLLKLRGRETEYLHFIATARGYVEMLEASKADVVLPEDRKRTFESLPVFKRLVIVLAGPVMNLVFRCCCTLRCSSVTGRSCAHDRHRAAEPSADGKLLPGDRIMSIDGKRSARSTR